MRWLACVVSLLLLPVTVHAQEETRSGNAAGIFTATGASLGLMEIVGSEACIQQGTCREVNKVLPDGRGAGATFGRSAIKAAGTTAATVALLKLRKTHPRWALLGSVGFAAWNGWLAANAFDHLRKGQR